MMEKSFEVRYEGGENRHHTGWHNFHQEDSHSLKTEARREPIQAGR